jgi:hypothetical protein
MPARDRGPMDDGADAAHASRRAGHAQQAIDSQRLFGRAHIGQRTRPNLHMFARDQVQQVSGVLPGDRITLAEHVGVHLTHDEHHASHPSGGNWCHHWTVGV